MIWNDGYCSDIIILLYPFFFFGGFVHFQRPLRQLLAPGFSHFSLSNSNQDTGRKEMKEERYVYAAARIA